KRSNIAEETSSDKFVIQHNLQAELGQICNSYGIPPPTYTLQEIRVIDEVQYVRYYGALVSGSIGPPSVSLGRFARTEYDAKEDVAAILIRRLLSSAGHTIRDFNYYNVQLLQEQLEDTMKENLELKFELGIQNQKTNKP
ncbi:hypothetical protein A2U01_0002242, partial [Trifolium medium]|nr:hypothetical protein [Trifolium medium]